MTILSLYLIIVFMKKRVDKKNEELVISAESQEKKLSTEIYNKDTDDHSKDSAVAPHVKLAKKHAEDATKVKNVVKTQLGFPQNEKDTDNISKRQKAFKNAMTVTFIVFVFAVFTYTFYNDFFATDKEFPSWEILVGIFKKSWQYLIFAIISLIVYYLFKGIKLSFMCKNLTGRWQLKTCLETGIIGVYYNCVTPLAVGGQPFEIYHLSKHGVRGGAAAAMPIATFFMNQLAFVGIGTAAFFLFKSNALQIPSEIVNAFPPIYSLFTIIGLVGCFVMPLLVLIFAMMPKVGAKLVKSVFNLGAKLKLVKDPEETTAKTVKNIFHNATCLKKVITSPLAFIFSLILSVGERVAEASIAFFALKMFGYNLEGVSPILEWLQVVQIAIILYASISFIPTPGNSGAADLSFYLLFEVGLFAGLAFPAMLVWRILSFYSHIVIGFLFINLKKRSDHKKELNNIPLS